MLYQNTHRIKKPSSFALFIHRIKCMFKSRAMRSKKDDDFHSRSYKNRGASGLLGDVINSPIAIIIVLFMCAIGLYSGVRYMVFSESTTKPVTNGMQYNAKGDMYTTTTTTTAARESSDNMMTRIKQTHEHLENGAYTAFDTETWKLTHLCATELPFDIHHDALLTLHAQVSHMFYHIQAHGQLSQMSYESARVGSDGSIIDMKHTHHKVGESGKCSLLAQMITYSIRVNADSMIKEKEDEFAETYGDFKKSAMKTMTMSGTDIKSDTAKMIQRFHDFFVNKESHGWETDYYMEFGMDTYCPHVKSHYDQDTYRIVIKHMVDLVHEVVEINNGNGASIPVDAMVTLNKETGKTQVDDMNSIHAKQESGISCSFVNHILHYQSGNVNDKITKMMSEFKVQHVVAYEQYLKMLVNQQCPMVVSNMKDESSTQSFYGHLKDLMQYVTSGKPIGNTDFIVSTYGTVMHREHAVNIKLSQKHWLECPLISMIASTGNTANQLNDENAFNKESEQLQEEVLDLESHRVEHNARHDVGTLIKHLRNKEHFEFSVLLHRVIRTYHGDLLNEMTSETRDTLRESLEMALSIVVDNSHSPQNAINEGEVAVIEKTTGRVYAVKPGNEKIANGEYLRSDLLDEVCHIVQHINGVHESLAIHDTLKEREISEIANNDVSLDDIHELFTLVKEMDFISAQRIMERLIKEHCDNEMQQIISANPSVQRNQMEEHLKTHGLALISDIVHYGRVQRDAHAVITSDGKLNIVKSASVTQTDGSVICKLFEEMIAYVNQLDSESHVTEKMQESEIRKQDDILYQHVNTYEHIIKAKQTASYYNNLVKRHVQERDMVAFDSDIEFALNEQCKDGTFIAMTAYAKRNLKSQLWTYANGRSTLYNAVYTLQGDLMEESMAKSYGEAFGKCEFLAQLVKQLKQ